MPQNNHFSLSIAGAAQKVISFSCEEAIDSPCRSFHTVVANSEPLSLIGKELTVQLGEVKIYFIVERIAFEQSPSEAKVELSGRDHIAYAVDSSSSAQEFNGTQDLKDIATKLLQPFGIKLHSKVTRSLPLTDWTVGQGETAYESLEQAARLFGVFFVPVDGKSLQLSDVTSERVAKLDHASQITKLSLQKDISERFHAYRVDAQELTLFSEKSAEVTVEDAEIFPLRTLTVVTNGKETALERAKMEMNIRRIRGLELSLTMPGIKATPLGQRYDLNLAKVKGRYLGKKRSITYEVGSDTTTCETTISLGLEPL